MPVANEDRTVPFPENSDSDDKDTADSNEDLSKLWCYCNQPSSEEMIMRDSKKCNIKWFHFSYLGLEGNRRVNGIVHHAKEYINHPKRLS